LLWRPAGTPDFDVNIGDVKPMWVVGVAALTMLVLRQPLSGSKNFGDWTVSKPFKALAKVRPRRCVLSTEAAPPCRRSLP